MQTFLQADEKLAPLPITAARFSGPGPLGSGPENGPAAPGDGVEKGPPPQGNVDKPPTDLPPLTPGKPAPVTPDSDKDKAIRRPSGPDRDVFGVLDGIRESAAKKLGKTVKPGPGGVGGDGGTLSPTMRRALRWNLLFNTRDERDYLNQLVGLGAILAVPIDEAKGRFLVVRDLRNPKTAREDDISGLDRIFWVDDNPGSLPSLFAALNVRRPAYFIALFPRELELKMRRLEEAYAREHHGSGSEEDIRATTFEVIPGPDIRVVKVEMKKR